MSKDTWKKLAIGFMALAVALSLVLTAMITWLVAKRPGQPELVTNTPVAVVGDTPETVVTDTLAPLPTETAMPTLSLAINSPSSTEYGLVPQPYVPHPSSYQETGVGNTITWEIKVKSNTVLIVGGYRVDGVEGGVFKAIPGPTTVTTTVTDGFYSVVASEWGEKEYCFRVGEAIRYGWAHAHQYPLEGWSCR